MNKNKTAHLFHNSLKETLVCPITRMIFLYPVIASDGIVYECQAIEKWLKTKDISPGTGKRLNDKELIPALLVKNIINDFLSYKPKLKKLQYVLEKKEHQDFADEVTKILENKSYNDLYQYQNFKISYFLQRSSKNTLLYDFLSTASWEFVKYFLENTIDISSFNNTSLPNRLAKAGKSNIVDYLVQKNIGLDNIDSNGQTLLYYIISNCNNELISKIKAQIIAYINNDQDTLFVLLNNSSVTNSALIEIMNNLKDIDYPNAGYQQPIHLACQKQDFDLIKYLVDKKVNLDIPDDKGMCPIHYLIENTKLSIPDKIQLLQKFDNLEHQNKDGERAIHLACNSNNIDLVKYLISRNVELNCPDEDGWNPIHYLCNNKALNAQMLICLLEKNIDLECKTSDGEKPIHLLAKASKLTLLKLLIDHGAIIEDRDESEAEEESQSRSSPDDVD